MQTNLELDVDRAYAAVAAMRGRRLELLRSRAVKPLDREQAKELSDLGSDSVSLLHWLAKYQPVPVP